MYILYIHVYTCICIWCAYIVYTMYSIPYDMYYILYNILYTIYYILYTIYYILHTMDYLLYATYYMLFAVYYIPCIYSVCRPRGERGELRRDEDQGIIYYTILYSNIL